MSLKHVTVAIVFIAVTLTATGAWAAPEVSKPDARPYQVAIADGKAVPFTVEAGGFKPGSVVYVQQCNGRQPTEPNWLPARDCDIGSSPAGAIVDANGVARFPAEDPNHVLRAFVGTSPQELFNCLAPGAASPDNGLQDFRECQIRVSSSTLAVTVDQAMAPIIFGAPAAAGTAAGAQSAADSDSLPWLAVVSVAVVILAIVAFVVVRSRRNRQPVSAKSA